jgi:hypothetical protein
MNPYAAASQGRVKRLRCPIQTAWRRPGLRDRKPL